MYPAMGFRAVKLNQSDKADFLSVRGKAYLETLACTDARDDFLDLATLVKRSCREKVKLEMKRSKDIICDIQPFMLSVERGVRMR
jgi:hypothetical protein